MTLNEMITIGSVVFGLGVFVGATKYAVATIIKRFAGLEATVTSNHTELKTYIMSQGEKLGQLSTTTELHELRLDKLEAAVERDSNGEL